MRRAEAEPPSCFQRMYRAFQETAVCASTMNLPRKCRSAVPRFDGRATASPFDATRTSEALVRAPAAEILGIRSSHRIQKLENLSAASKNPYSWTRDPWPHPPYPLSVDPCRDLQHGPPYRSGDAIPEILDPSGRSDSKSDSDAALWSHPAGSYI